MDYRRTISTLLVIVILSGLVPSIADCQHKNLSSARLLVDTSYKQNNESTHQVVNTYRVDCADCNAFVKWETETSNEAHNFNISGKCRNCGYQKTSNSSIVSGHCSHRTKKNDESWTYKSTGSSSHKITKTYKVICKSCGEVLSTRTETVTQKHILDSNGDCEVCDYRASCQHKSSKKVEIGSGYETLNETYHQHYVVYNRVCANSSCGKVLEPNIVEKTKEKHSFSNNTCKVCGYRKQAELKVSVSRGTGSAKVGDYLSASASASGGSGNYQYSWTATRNGSKVGSSSEAGSNWGVTATSAGTYKFKVTVKDKNTGKTASATTSGITVNAQECQHQNKQDQYIKTEYIKLSDSKHTVRNYYKVVCADCKAVINSSYYKDSSENHSFGANNTCVCGYTKPTENCKHDQGSNETEISSRQESISSSDHKKITVYRVTCKKCGATLDAKKEKATVEKHKFNNKGVCACGYVKPSTTCDHATNRTKIRSRTEQKDSKQHYVITTYRLKCECGKVDKTEESKVVEAHQFNPNGICECGYSKPAEELPTQDAQHTIGNPTDSDNKTNDLSESPAGENSVCPVYGATHKLSYTGYEKDHPHKVFKRCACGYAEYTGKNQTVNGRELDESMCCLCYGHKWHENMDSSKICMNCGMNEKGTLNVEEETQQQQTVDLQTFLSENAKNNPQLTDAIIEFIKVDNFVSHDGSSTAYQTTEAGKRNWDDWRFRVASDLYEKVPTWVDPVTAIKDGLVDWGLDGEDEKVVLMVELIRESIIDKKDYDSQAIITLNEINNKAKEYKDIVTILDPKGIVIEGLTGVDFSSYNESDIKNVLKFFEDRKKDVTAVTELLSVGTSEIKIIEKQRKENLAISTLCGEYWSNLQTIELIEKSGDTTVKRACQIIKGKMGEEVEQELNKAVEVAKGIRPIADLAFSKGLKAIFPGYNRAVSGLKAVSNSTERILNDKLRTQDKIDASKNVLLVDQVTSQDIKTMLRYDGTDEDFITQLTLYYTAMEHKFDALEDYLNSDKSTEFEVMYLNQERKNFENAYKNVIDAYYCSAAETNAKASNRSNTQTPLLPNANQQQESDATPTPRVTPTLTPTKTHSRVGIAKSTTAVRSGPGTQYPILTYLRKGQKVTIRGSRSSTDGKTGMWFMISEGGTQGYAAAGMIEQQR